jgi:hypothetical protein
MSGFGAMKKEEKEEEKQLKKEKKEEVKVLEIKKESSTKYPNFEAEFMAQTSKKKVKPSSTFCTIVGHDGTGKTGLAMDAHMSKYTDNEMMWVIDHDNGGLSCKHAHYGDTDRIRLWSPWVYQDTNRTAYHYPKTHERIMGIMRYAIEYAEKQTEADFEGQPLKSLLITAIDQFDQICMFNMKIYDLDLKAMDAVEASNARLNQEIGWNWGIRTTRFKQLTALCQKLNLLGVDVYWETHLKEDKEGKFGYDGWKIAWEKNATNDMFQIVWCTENMVRGADGQYTGESRYVARFFKSKTNPDLKNQKRVYFVTKEGEKAEWFGLPELKDGSL